MIIREQLSYAAQLRRKPVPKNSKKPYWVVEDLVTEKTWNVEMEQLYPVRFKVFDESVFVPTFHYALR